MVFRNLKNLTFMQCFLDKVSAPRFSALIGSQKFTYQIRPELRLSFNLENGFNSSFSPKIDPSPRPYPHLELQPQPLPQLRSRISPIPSFSLSFCSSPCFSHRFSPRISPRIRPCPSLLGCWFALPFFV